MSKAKKPVTPKAAKPKKAPDYTSPAALQRYDFETQKEATKLEKETGEAKSVWLVAKERASEAKTNYEADLEALRKYVRDRAERRGKAPKPNLFQEHNEAAKEAEMRADNAAVASKAITTDPAVWPPEDLWKQFPIDRLTTFGLTAKDIEHIQAGEVKKGSGIGPLLTMGSLSQFTAAIPGTTYTRGYIDLKGIGQAGVDRISNAETAFWTAWRNGVGAKFALEQGLVKPEPPKPPKKGKRGAKDDSATGSGSPGDGPALPQGGATDATTGAVEPPKEIAQAA